MPRRRRDRAIETHRPGTVGYDTFETSRLGITGIPVEGFKFTQGATVLGRFTSADATIAFADGSFTPDAIQRTALDFSQEDTAQNVNVSVPLTNAVALLYRTYNPTSPVTLTIFRKHRSDAEEIVIFVGKIVSCSFDEVQATFNCAPISQVFARKVPFLSVQTPCNWALYGAGCGVSKASFKVSGTVAGVESSTVTAAAIGTKPDGWFNNGWLEISSGEREFVISHVGSSVVLMRPMTLTVGQAFDIYPGCDRSEAVCASKFSNLNRHLGFPRVPTRNPYSGSLT